MTIFRVVRDVFVIAACVCVILLTYQVFTFEAKASRVVQQFGDTAVQPDQTPGATGCPFGPGLCGG